MAETMPTDDPGPTSVQAFFVGFGLSSLVVVLLAVVSVGLLDGRDRVFEPHEVEIDAPQIYATRCAGCHGDEGQGVVGPALGGGEVAQRFPDIADQIAVIASGRGLMPGFDHILSDEEVRAVAEYERGELGR